MNMTLDALAFAYAAAKADEDRAIERRRALAMQIQAFTGHTAEGQKTYEANGWKVAIKAPVITSMDWKKWQLVRENITPSLWPIEIKTVLDEKGVKYLKDNEPEIYLTLSECLTTKPGAVQITVTAPKEEAA
jgi:hypothetical protein